MYHLYFFSHFFQCVFTIGVKFHLDVIQVPVKTLKMHLIRESIVYHWAHETIFLLILHKMPCRNDMNRANAIIASALLSFDIFFLLLFFVAYNTLNVY